MQEISRCIGCRNSVTDEREELQLGNATGSVLIREQCKTGTDCCMFILTMAQVLHCIATLPYLGMHLSASLLPLQSTHIYSVPTIYWTLATRTDVFRTLTSVYKHHEQHSATGWPWTESLEEIKCCQARY